MRRFAVPGVPCDACVRRVDWGLFTHYVRGADRWTWAPGIPSKSRYLRSFMFAIDAHSHLTRLCPAVRQQRRCLFTVFLPQTKDVIVPPG